MEKMIIISLMFLASVSGVYSDSHSMRFYDTGVSDPGSGLPEYSSLEYVDDREITNYNSDTGILRPTVPWMEKLEPEFWEEQTQICKVDEAVARNLIRIWMSRFNQTGGIHVYQNMYGCELGDDGSITGYDQYGYDGKEFLALDSRTWTFVPTMAQAQSTTQRWNSPDVQKGEYFKNYLENICIEWLKKHLEDGKEDLERRVRPRVKVSSQKEEDIMKLHCQVYGFHPRAVDVKWMNGEDEVHSYETTHVLPNPDGTYQIRASAEVTPKDGDSYSCYVDHHSLEEPLLVRWEPKRDFPVAVIISVVVVIVIAVVLTSVGVFIYKKKRDNFVLFRASDTSTSDVAATALL